MSLSDNISTNRRIIALLFTIWLWLPLSVWAATDYTVETIPNTRLSNRLNHVSNPNGILQVGDVAYINERLNMLEDSLGIEVAVVAVGSIGNEEPRMFATDLFKHWGLGKKGKDNGLLMLLVTDPAQRTIVFETGYGLEGTLPDAICYRLQQRYMILDLKAGDYSTGMVKGVAAVTDYLMASDYERAGIIEEADDDDFSPWIVSGMAILFLGVVVLVNYLQRRPRICPRCGKKTLTYRGRLTLVEPTYYASGMAEDVYRCTNCHHEERNRHTLDRLRRSGGGPIIFGGGGGFSGGMGGGSWGGGSSGGGGASSRF